MILKIFKFIKMVHKNYKWNISLEEGKRLCLENIDDIISEQKNNSIELNELVFLLNSRSKENTPPCKINRSKFEC